MPIVNVRVPESSFADEQVAAIVAELTDAIADAEQIPDDPGHRARIVVIWEEVPSGRIFANGANVSGIAIPVFVDMQPPEQALTDDHAAAFVAAVQDLFERQAPPDRAVMTSVIMPDVPDGRWGIGGSISRVADFARSAGYRHLQHLVT